MSSRDEVEREYVKRVEPPRMDLGDEIAGRSAPATTCRADRSPSSRLYDFGESSRKIRSAFLNSSGSTGRLHQLPRRQQTVEVAGIDPEVRGVETGFDAVGAAENPDLALLAFGRWIESHLAAADEDERGRALIDFRHEHRAFGQT